MDAGKSVVAEDRAKNPGVIFFAYVTGVFAVAAGLAWPVHLLLGTAGIDVPFHQFTFRLLHFTALAGLWPLLRALKLNVRAGWGFASTERKFTTGFLEGFVLGVLTLGILSLVLLALGVRVPRPSLEFSAAVVGIVFLKAIIVGLVVGTLEEIWFRGALHGVAVRYAGPLMALIAIPLVYGSLHFIRPDVAVGAADLQWSSSLVVLGNAFHRMTDFGFADSFIALATLGWLLALVRQHTGRVAECIGMHAGSVMVIQILRRLTMTDSQSPWAFAVGSFDGVVGYFAFIWFALLAFGYIWLSRRGIFAGVATK